MHINANVDAKIEQQLNYLSEITGQSVYEVLRASVEHYYLQMRAQHCPLEHFGAFIGKSRSGRNDVAGSYKEQLAQAWAGQKSLPCEGGGA